MYISMTVVSPLLLCVSIRRNLINLQIPVINLFLLVFLCSSVSEKYSFKKKSKLLFTDTTKIYSMIKDIIIFLSSFFQMVILSD